MTWDLGGALAGTSGLWGQRGTTPVTCACPRLTDSVAARTATVAVAGAQLNQPCCSSCGRAQSLASSLAVIMTLSKWWCISHAHTQRQTGLVQASPAAACAARGGDGGALLSQSPRLHTSYTRTHNLPAPDWMGACRLRPGKPATRSPAGHGMSTAAQAQAGRRAVCA